MYFFTKHLHLTAVVLSVLLLITRFVWRLRHSPMLQRKWVKIVPHIVDTVLLGSAIALCIIVPWNPLQHPWLLQKILLVVVYILAGFWLLKRASTTSTKWAAFAVAISCIALAGKMAVTKQALFI